MTQQHRHSLLDTDKPHTRFSAAGRNNLTTGCDDRRLKKRQGTKSREVGQWPRSECYGDLMPAPSSMIGVTLAGFELGVCTYGRSAESIRHFGGCSKRLKVRSAR